MVVRVPPGVCIALVGTGLALLNFGIDEFINPRLRAAGLSRPRPGARHPELGLTPVVSPELGLTHGRRGRDRRWPDERGHVVPRYRERWRGHRGAWRPGTGDPRAVRGLRVGRSGVHAVVDADLVLHRGELLGLAGESGSGKSTLAYAVTRLLRAPGVITAGEVLLHSPDGGEDVRPARPAG